jgi:F0F1-type ATP synthase assembly protein I
VLPKPPTPEETGYYFALAQVGLEMVFPMGIGIALDYAFGWTPWATIIGLILGFVGGMFHLVMLVNRHDARNRSGSGKGGQ